VPASGRSAGPGPRLIYHLARRASRGFSGGRELDLARRPPYSEPNGQLATCGWHVTRGWRKAEVASAEARHNGPALPALPALAGGVAILGFAAIFVKWAHAPGTVTALYRMLIGSALVTPLMLARNGRALRTMSRRGVGLAALGGALFGCDMAIWMTAVNISGATMPTLAANTVPLWVGLGALLVLGERQTRLFWAGLVIAVAGVVLTVGPGAGVGSAATTGILLGLAASFFYASFQLLTQEGRKHLDTVSFLWISTLGAAAALAVINLVLGRPLTGFDRGTYLSFLALGGIVQFLGWLLINFAQGHIRASVVAPTLLGQPIVTAVFASLLLNERLTPWHLGGGAVVLAGIYIVTRSRTRGMSVAP
jgi:drug/metabolite transporter (DMT)-like permease